MNIKHLRKRIGGSFRLRPKALWRDRADVTDERWELDSAEDSPARIRLRHPEFGETVELQSDNIREFRSPDFILLRCRLIVQSSGIQIEPLVEPKGSRPEPLTLSELLLTVRQAPLLARESVRSRLHGIAVRVSGRLATLTPLGNDRVRVGIIAPEDDVFCEVDLNLYPALRVAAPDIQITVMGLFSGTVIAGTWLDKAEITL
jgi:hypothetical protein